MTWIVTDDAGNTATCMQKVRVSVENSAPVFESYPVLFVDEDDGYRYDIEVNDIDNDKTTVQAINIPDWMELSNGNFPVLTGLPTNDMVGAHSIELQVTDGNGYSVQKFEVIVVNTNDAPITEDDYVEYQEAGTPIYVDVLANDYDIDFNDELVLLSAIAENGTPFQIEDNMVVVEFDNLPTRDLNVSYLIADKSGSSSEGLMEVKFIVEDLVWASQGFSPNGDGMNDYWHIRNIENFPNNSVTIYNKWGDRVASFDGYNNTSIRWMGESRYTLVDGIYLYAISLESSNQEVKGFIYLKR